ncbi:MAG TPA: hypothetical protein EYG85_12860, partial [Crocinitomix sp.]|nr:hypothetical protein [Crocinitomix sp.]
MIFKKIPTIFIATVVLISVVFAGACMKWLPIPSDGLVVVVPINEGNPHTTDEDLDCDNIIDSKDTDIDGDGIPNTSDAFPRNPSESKDTDGDGVGDNKDRPTGNSQNVSVDNNVTNHNIIIVGNDDTGTVTFSIVQQPTHGTLTGTAPNLVYTPNSDYVGTDYFTYTVNDGSLTSSIVKINLNVFSSVKKSIKVSAINGNTASYNSIATFYVS